MAQKNSEEIQDSSEEKKVRSKQFNKFLSDYFNWVVGFAVAIVFVSGFFVLVLPKYQQTVEFINSTNQQQVLDVSSRQDELTKIQRFLAAYKSIDPKYIDKVKAIAPVAQNKEELFSELNYLVSVNQLFLQSISLSSTDSYLDQELLPVKAGDQPIANSLQTVTVVLEVRGTTYESFKNFLSSLENNLRLMDVLSIRFDPQGQTTSLTIDTYYSKN
ncbi:MAG TPA: hypothetical protein VMC41_03310 [Candidatus Nanoarchaeia archaeon]|nr:hypothetical protein [Candidatus Nanoarchaeia archaeon]